MSGNSDGDGAAAGTVAVAVKSSAGRGSQRAVQWVADNLMQKADGFVLVHVMPTVTTVPTPSGERISIEDLDAKIVRLYVHDAKEECKKKFVPFARLLRKKKVEILVLEGDSPASVLLRYISDSRISTLLVGSCSASYSCFKRKPKSSLVPSIVRKNAPLGCHVLVVSRYGVRENMPRPSLANGSKEFLLTKEGKDSQMISKELPLTGSFSVESRVDNNFELSSTSDLSGPKFHASLHHRQHTGENFLNSEIVKSNSQKSTNSKKSNIEAEVEQLHQEIQSTLSMYNQTCEDLVYVQKKVNLLSLECLEEEMRLDAAKRRQESLRKVAAEEKEKHLEAVKEIEMAKNQYAKEANERQIAESIALKEFSEKQKIIEALFSGDKRYRRYSAKEIEEATGVFSEEKVIGSGAYGKVYNCHLDHTPVAIKILQSDASNKKDEFLKEVEVLSLLRHPHIVLLLGACPELGCLVYEYMENGSLEDYLFPENSRSPLPWVVRFRIVYEVACGLAFLHNSGPEPIVHRDLKPGNILLNKNYVAKIGDVGLAKIISDVVPDNVTEYRNSMIAGTFCYMDPEYQRTGTLRPKSDVYALGVIALQLLTATHPNGIIHKVEKAIRTGSFYDILDKSVPNWPLAQVEELAQVALKCCKLRCRDRPDLETEVLPVLKRLAGFADATRRGDTNKFPAPSHYCCPILLELMQEPYIAADGFTYERLAIETWLSRCDISPVTKRKMPNKVLTPNHILSSAIQDWRSHVPA
ncbi:OLC1v1037772C1 [Oldenlandia corymbosa var. corymbosa]|uniref:OLC1v1037772C1 n=1 Tax=Oldenlandia corymbosa var. corymbosa TaxID=529605 RepID=A0AAV1D1G0_OLDCO|nr:OLC1v1037772C1 [Oldenlandia corymbosa var. corymbosa]